MARRSADPAALGEERLHDAVFERMEGNHDEPSAGFEHALRCCERVDDLTEFIIHKHAQRLEGARRWMDLARPLMQHRGDDVGECARGGDRLPGARLDDRARDRPGEALFAERCDDRRKISLGRSIQQIGGARSLAAHAHVDWAVVAEGESALRLVELHRGDAEIEQDPSDSCVPEPARNLFEIGESLLDHGEPATGLLDQPKPARYGIAVAVDADNPRARHVEDRPRVPAGAEGAVDVDATLARREIRDDLAGEHGNMTGRAASGRSAAAAPPHSRALCAFCAATREPSCFFNARTVPVASASCARKRPGSQIWNLWPRPTNEIVSVMPA